MMLLLDKLNMACSEGQKLLFVLIDPDHFDTKHAGALLKSAGEENIDAFFVGGSLITGGDMGATIQSLKTICSVPVCIFPGNYRQIDLQADAILFMSLISGRNPEFLIGNQVVAAPLLKNSGLEIIPTGYMLIDGGKLTTAHYMSATLPIPADKPEVAAATALAGQMLGMKCIYADAGSGAEKSITSEMIRSVYDAVDLPLIAGGGIRSVLTATELYEAGATALVVGNAAWTNPNLISQICHLKQI
jgi:phosphoglycerol geranylgeranyltransferase